MIIAYTNLYIKKLIGLLMKKCAFFFLIVALLPIVIAQSNLEVEQTVKEQVIIAEVDTKAKYTLTITNNNNATDFFEVYSLVGVSIIPKQLGYINKGETKNFNIEISLHERTRNERRGIYLFDYEIKGRDTGFFEDRMSVEIVNFKDALAFSIKDIEASDDQVTIYVENLLDYSFEELKITSESDVFTLSENVKLDPFGKVTLRAPINAESVKQILAGEYEAIFNLEFKGAIETSKATYKQLEISGVSSASESEGLIIRKSTFSKTNQGNTEIEIELTDKKDILSRLLTTYSIKPSEIERKGFVVHYRWRASLNPAESFTIESVTNYTLPFIVLIIFVLVIVGLKIYIRKPLELEKRSYFVKTKGGEFALKIKVVLKARDNVEDVRLDDWIPHITKLYEGFGKVPDNIDEKSRRLTWKVGDMRAGEERVFSYIIYSKIKIIGSLDLPKSVAHYKHEGKILEAFSNKTLFSIEASESVE